MVQSPISRTCWGHRYEVAGPVLFVHVLVAFRDSCNLLQLFRPRIFLSVSLTLLRLQGRLALFAFWVLAV